MCLIVFAWQARPGCRLALAANRDERHDRPSEALDWWHDDPAILAGRDVEAGGTWLGVARSGRFAAVTNYRDPAATVPGNRSRGRLVSDFLSQDVTPADYVTRLPLKEYSGFSLLVSDGDTLWYSSNREDTARELRPGVYGLSNASLDTAWPKLVRSRERLAARVADGVPDVDWLLALLGDRMPPSDAELAAHAVPHAGGTANSAPFIVQPYWGTRCTTALVWSNGGRISIGERSYDPGGNSSGEARFDFVA